MFQQEKVVLPKQWKDWCRAARLRTRTLQASKGWKPLAESNRGLGNWFYLHGRGHEWRVSNHGMLQCGDTYDEFDRWALCAIHEVEMPKTKAEFVAAVKSLVKLHAEDVERLKARFPFHPKYK